MRWELIPFQHNPMSLVRVKDGSKRQREPNALSVEEFRKVLDYIAEPFRTMCVVAMCLGLRLGLRWRDIDWDGLRLAVRQAYVYGKQGDVKTQASQRWMPLDRSLAEKLREHKARLAPLAKPNDWVFANPETGRPFWPGRIQENWLVPASIGRGGGDRTHALVAVLGVGQNRLTLRKHGPLMPGVSSLGSMAPASGRFRGCVLQGLLCFP